MGVTSRRYAKHVLYLAEEPTTEDEDALRIVKAFDPRVEVHQITDDRGATPWLATAKAFFYGLKHIQGYVKGERH